MRLRRTLELREVVHPLTYGPLGGRVKCLLKVTTSKKDGRLRFNRHILSKIAHFLRLLNLTLLEFPFSLSIR
jgi:hypothetical protein